MKKKIYLILIALLGIHLFLLINLRFTAWPEMVSYPFLRNHGYLLYKDMVHPYPPVLTMTLSIIYKIFGYKLIILEAFTWLLIIFNDIFIFLIVKKMTGRYIFALFSLTFYVLSQPFLEGNQLWFDLAIVPPVLLANYFLLLKNSNRNIFFAGLILGVAALIKQTAILVFIVGALYVIYDNRNLKKVLFFLLGPVVMGLVLLVRLITEGALQGFINWALIYPSIYWTKFPGYVQMVLTHKELLIMTVFIFPFVTLLIKLRKDLSKDKKILLLLINFVVSLFLVYPRFSFFHFQLGIVFSVILYGVLANKLHLGKFLYIAFAICIILEVILIITPLKSNWHKEARFWSDDDIKIAGEIADSTKVTDKLYLLGLNSNLYAFANRFPPKPWYENFGWYFEIPNIQNEVIAKWNNNMPKYIVIKNVQHGNWYDLGTYRPSVILDWIERNFIIKKDLAGGNKLWIIKD